MPNKYDAKAWTGDASFQAYVSDFRKGREYVREFLKKHPVAWVIPILPLAFLSWLLLFNLVGNGDADKANSFFTLLTFLGLIGSIALQSRALSAQIKEMRQVTEATKASNEALQRQIRVMQTTTLIQAVSAKVGLIEAVERYKQNNLDHNREVDETDEFILRADGILRQVQGLETLVSDQLKATGLDKMPVTVQSNGSDEAAAKGTSERGAL